MGKLINGDLVSEKIMLNLKDAILRANREIKCQNRMKKLKKINSNIENFNLIYK